MVDTGNVAFESRVSHSIPTKDQKMSPTPMTEIVLNMISDFEVTRPHNINIINVAERYKIQHRRAYDLFNLLTALKVCRNVERGRLAWNAIGDAAKTVSSEYIKIETESLFKPTRELFDLGPSPSLGTIATRFMSFFVYFGVDRITLKQAIPMFRHQNCDIKSLERRLYLVVGMLKILNLLSHSKGSGEYEIALDVDAIRARGMKKKHAIALKAAPWSLEATLNKLDDTYVDNLLEARKNEYKQLSL